MKQFWHCWLGIAVTTTTSIYLTIVKMQRYIDNIDGKNFPVYNQV